MFAFSSTALRRILARVTRVAPLFAIVLIVEATLAPTGDATMPGEYRKRERRSQKQKYDMMKRSAAALLTAIVIFLVGSLTTAADCLVTGRVTDLDTGEPLASVTIRVVGTGRSMLTNAEGMYRLRLDSGNSEIRFTHVGYYSETVHTGHCDSAITLDAALRPSLIELPPMRVYEENYNPAEEIIVEAIRRKQEILDRLNSYSFDAYTRLTVVDPTKPDSQSVKVIGESQIEGRWEHPDKYSETITARKQTANIEAGQLIIGLGGILDFNQNRLDLGSHSLVSPTATDALDYYEYYILDTLSVDGRLVYRLELQPKNEIDPLFKGHIDIVDSTFEVVGVDVGLTPGAELAYFEDPRYRQVCAEFEGRYWMPVEVSFEGLVDLPIPGIPVVSFDYRAALHNYYFELRLPRDAFLYALEVTPDVDDVDSAEWDSGQVIPLTDLERRGYSYQDSLAAIPPSLPMRLLKAFGWLASNTMLNYSRFHFNRVEGAYLGHGHAFWLDNRTHIYGRAGWAFAAEQFQHLIMLRRRLDKLHRIDLTLHHHHTIHARPSLTTSAGYNSTPWAFWMKTDQLDYYRTEGFGLGVSGDLVQKLRLDVGYTDAQHYSEHWNERFSVFNNADIPRFNPAIADGHLRSLTASLTFDNRELVKIGRMEGPTLAYPLTVLELEAEYSSGDMLNSDFDFTRYGLRFSRIQRTLGLGITSLTAYAGASEGTLPPQRYYTIDFGDEVFGSSLVFKTLEEGFSGDRAAMLYANHNFGVRIWQRSGIPLIKDIPFSLGVHGGVFVTDFDDRSMMPAVPEGRKSYMHAAQHPYREAGFSIGRLPPLSLRLFFTWQLSDYDAPGFSVHWDIRLF